MNAQTLLCLSFLLVALAPELHAQATTKPATTPTVVAVDTNAEEEVQQGNHRHCRRHRHLRSRRTTKNR